MKHKPTAAREPFSSHLRRYWQLYAMMALPFMYLILFKYVPMFGNLLAFRRYRPGLGPFGSEWVGLTWPSISPCPSSSPCS